MPMERVLGTIKFLVVMAGMIVLLYLLSGAVAPVATPPEPDSALVSPESVSEEAATAEPSESADEVAAAAEPAVGETLPAGAATAGKDPGEEYYRMGLYPEALAYWKAQAEAGNAHAAYRYAVEYHDGKANVVAKRDLDIARTYYEQAAAAGHAKAQYDLGSMYEFGMGVPLSIEKAAELYGKAARGGVPEAQWNYATMLETGEGVEKDELQALMFYLLAGEGGFAVPPVNEAGIVDPQALSAPEALAERLTPEQVIEARQRAIDFVPEDRPL